MARWRVTTTVYFKDGRTFTREGTSSVGNPLIADDCPDHGDDWLNNLPDEDYDMAMDMTNGDKVQRVVVEVVPVLRAPVFTKD